MYFVINLLPYVVRYAFWHLILAHSHVSETDDKGIAIQNENLCGAQMWHFNGKERFNLKFNFFCLCLLRTARPFHFRMKIYRKLMMYSSLISFRNIKKLMEENIIMRFYYWFPFVDCSQYEPIPLIMVLMTPSNNNCN